MLRTVAAVEQDGLESYVVMMKFEVPGVGFDLEGAVKKACAEFVQTEEGQKALEWTGGNFNWGDFVNEVPNGVCEKYGFRLVEAVAAEKVVDLNEQMLDELEVVLEEEMVDVEEDAGEDEIERMVDDLRLFYDARVNGKTLFVDCWQGESVEIFLADDGGLMCLLPDEDEARALRERIQDVEPGDAFLFGGGGSIRTASEAAHQNFDEPDNPWILYGDDGDCYFEEDFGIEVGKKMRELLEKVKADLVPVEYSVQYPLQNYDDAVGHLCEKLNEKDEAFDLEGVPAEAVLAPVKVEEFVPIFKSENYFGIYVWHNDENAYYLVNRNSGDCQMVLGDSFEFVGQNMLDCMKDEKVLHVANTEFMRYLIDFSLDNVKGVVPEQELRGIAVLEAALRAEWRKEGACCKGPSLLERIEAAVETAGGANSKGEKDSKGKDLC